MTLTLARSGSDWIMKDGKFATNCECCDHTVDCNPSPIPNDITLVFTFLCVQFSVTLHWHPSTGEGPFWSYDDLVDIDICDGFRFRQVVLKCIGSSWFVAFVYTERDGAGHPIQQVADTDHGMGAVQVISTNPLCLTTTFPGYTSPFGTACGPGTAYFAIGAGCSVMPPCCDWSGEASTATVSFNINSGAVVGSFSIPKVSSHSYAGFGTDCNLGDGHNVIRLSASFTCATDCIWLCSMTIRQETDGVATRFAQWTTGVRHSGEVGIEPFSGNKFSINCSPPHLHYEGTNNGTVIAGASVTCGGKTYPFGANGTASVVFDIVTP